MLFHIKHITRYRYSKAVFCEPFTIRLRPRVDDAQRLIRYQLSVDPAPAGQSEYLDVEGNTAAQCWFNGPTCSLQITMNCVVETLRTNAFDFLLEPGALELPVDYSDIKYSALQPYRAPESPADPRLASLVDELAGQADRQTVGFLTHLATWVSEHLHREIRPDGPPLPAGETLEKRAGSCRDLAVVFIEACRLAGLAARFVSGYQAELDVDGDRHLHAWAEVYLPGAGWRGFDPGQGVAVCDQHVALATGLHPAAAAPTVGNFRGTGATSHLETQVVIRTSGAQDNAGQQQLQAS